MPQNSNFSLPAVIDFGQNWTLLLWRQITVGTPRVHLGANGVPLELKNGSKPQKIAMPQKSNFRLPRGHRFRPKFDLTVMAPNHGRELLGFLVGPMGSHWNIKLGQNPKKLPCPKIGFIGHRFRPKFDRMVMVPNHGGDHLGSILGPMGSHWSIKVG